MEAVFLSVLNMSLSAAVVVPAVLLVRFLLRKAPKKWSYFVWGVVGFRLCCPVSFRTVFSIFQLAAIRPAAAQSVGQSGGMEYIPPDIGMMPQPQINIGNTQISDTINSVLPAVDPGASVNPMQIWITAGLVLWCVGMAALLFYGIVRCLHMKRRLTGAVLIRDNIYETDRVRTPFILGLFRPNIYLPVGLEEETLRYVLAHEQYHLRRRDHIVKSFAFLLLTVHWFNPLVWLAFYLMSRDMEMSCDEKVLEKETGIAKAYSTSLLSFAVNHHLPMPSPLAFGETGVKSRIKNVLRWKKPKIWATFVAAALCVLVAAACGTNPAEPSERNEKGKGTTDLSGPKQNDADDDAGSVLLNALKGATGAETDSLEEQFFRYYRAHNHELAMMPAFEKGRLPDWDALTLFVLLNSDDRFSVDGTQALSADAFSQTVTRFFGESEYRDESSKYLVFENDTYMAVPGDTMRNGYFRLKQITTDGNEYTAAFDAFFFTDPDFTEEYEKATPNQRAVRDRAQTKDFLQPGDFANAILEIFMESDYASVLDVSETITVTFSLSADAEHPFRYTACERTLQSETVSADHRGDHEVQSQTLSFQTQEGEACIIRSGEITAVSVRDKTGDVVVLNYEQSFELLGLFSDAELEERLHPTHLQAQTSDPVYVIRITFADRQEDILYSTELGARYFYRFTGTYGDQGDKGYVLAVNPEFEAFFDRLYGDADRIGPENWRRIYLDFWDHKLSALLEGVEEEIIAVGLFDTESDGVPEFAVWLENSRDGTLYYISDNRVCHNIGSIYEGPAPEGSDNVLRRQNGLAIDHDAMRTFLDAWQP